MEDIPSAVLAVMTVGVAGIENRALARETLSGKGLPIEFWGRVFFLIACRLSQARRDGP